MSSTATRALSTALIFARTLKIPVDRIRLEPRIYEASAEELVRVLHELEDTLGSLMLFGHNPGFTNLLNRFARDWQIDNLPTCGLVSLGFKTKSWQKLAEASAEVNFSAFPKDIRSHS